jgi:hypothetical protein
MNTPSEYDFIPVSSFDWVLELDGIDTLACQKAEIPSIEIKERIHHGGGFKVKTPYGFEVGDLTLSFVIRTELGAVDIWDWLLKVYNPIEGGTSQYFKDVLKTGILKLKSRDAKETIEKYVLSIFPKKVQMANVDKTISENIARKIVFSCTEFYKY